MTEVTNPTITNRYWWFAQPAKNKYIFPKNPNIGGKPPSDRRQRLKPNVMRGSFW